MTTRKRDTTAPVELADFLASARERQITIKAGNHMFRIDPPEIWPDAAMEAGKSDDPVRMAKALLGDDYDAWVGAGGSATALLGIVRDQAGLTPGE